jgi:hypothetical protein
MKPYAPVLVAMLAIGMTACPLRAAQPYTIVDTGQTRCYDNRIEISPPQPGQPFDGQDAQYRGIQPSYQDHGDGTVTDLNTGLTWQKQFDGGRKHTFAEAKAGAAQCRTGGHTDWRLPTIKELYSLMDFSGGMASQPAKPYLDTRYFEFIYGDPAKGEREIDAQYWSATEYVGRTMRGNATVFGVNFADGRIKGYPRGRGPGGRAAQQFVRYVRGNLTYGKNDFHDNGDGTIPDRATGLIWQKTDSGKALNWEEALAYARHLNLAGHDDWRLPNAKELQSIVDYTRAPDAADKAAQGPAVDPIFQITDPESYFWTSTTHLEGRPGMAGSQAVYVCFGQSMGYMGRPGASEKQRMNVHGAGAQRSDPKSGDPRQFPQGRGPQGDDVRIYNYVRCVRGGEVVRQNTTAPGSPRAATREVIREAGSPPDGPAGERLPPAPPAWRMGGGPSMSDPRLPASPVVAALDLNSDGTIDADELAKASDSLKKLDKNADGQLTPDDFDASSAGSTTGPSTVRPSFRPPTRAR